MLLYIRVVGHYGFHSPGIQLFVHHQCVLCKETAFFFPFPGFFLRSVQHQFENDWQGPPGQINTPKSEFNIVTEILVEIEVALEHSFLHRIYSHASLRNVIYRLWQSRNRLAALLDRLVPLALRVQLTTVLPKPW